jgi:hypothetical protein
VSSSAALALLTLVLWIRSYWATDGLRYQSGLTGKGIESRNGLVVWVNYEYSQTMQPRLGWIVDSSDKRAWPAEFRGMRLPLIPGSPGRTLWFARDYQMAWDGPDAVAAWGVQVPYWPITVAAAIALFCVRFIKNRRRARQGRCASFGYDLRATPDCCPECGTVMKAAAGSTSAGS